MKRIKENFEANLYDGSSPVKDDNVEAVTSIAHKAALEDSKKKYQAIKKDFKKQSDDLKDFIKDNHDRKNEGDKKAMRKLVLDESLFEHFNDDPNTYEDIFRILENIEFVAHESVEMDDEEMTPKMMRQTYDVLEDSLKELQERVEELEARDDSVEEAVENKERVFKKTRDPLADIIMQELIDGELIYIIDKNTGKRVPTYGESPHIKDDKVGVFYIPEDDNEEPCISVDRATPREVEAVKNIAAKYNRPFRKYRDKALICVKPEDWDIPYKS